MLSTTPSGPLSPAVVAELEACANAGASRLDAGRPGWAGELDLVILDIKDIRTCVFGQLYGGMGAGMNALNLDVSDILRYGVALSREFSDPGHVRQSLKFAVLTTAWRNAALARLSGPVAA